MRSAYINLTISTILFGSYLVASKIILKEVPVFTATLVRLVSAAVVLVCFVAYKSLPIPKFTKRDIAVLLLQSVMGIFLFSICAMYGVRMTGAIESGVIMSMVPIALSFVALVFLKEKMTVMRALGIALSVAGALSINVMSAKSTSGADGGSVLVGSLLLIGAVACEAVFLTFGKFLSKPVAPTVLSLILSAIGAVLFIGPSTAEIYGSARMEISLSTWMLMIYTGVAINGIAVVLIYDSMQKVDTIIASAFTALTPVSGTILSMIFLKEELRLYHVVGMIFVVIGVFIVTSGTHLRGKLRRKKLATAFAEN